MRTHLLRCLFAVLVLVGASSRAEAQVKPRHSDLLVDVLVFGAEEPVELASYSPDLRSELEKVLQRSRAYRSKRREPAGSSLLDMVRETWIRYERRLVAITDDPTAPALASAYVTKLKPCYEWEGYHNCPEREATFALAYLKAQPDGPFSAYLPLLAAHRWLCTVEAYEYEKSPKDVARSRRAYESGLSTARESPSALIRAAADALRARGTCFAQSRRSEARRTPIDIR